MKNNSYVDTNLLNSKNINASIKVLSLPEMGYSGISMSGASWKLLKTFLTFSQVGRSDCDKAPCPQHNTNPTKKTSL